MATRHPCPRPDYSTDAGAAAGLVEIGRLWLVAMATAQNDPTALPDVLARVEDTTHAFVLEANDAAFEGDGYDPAAITTALEALAPVLAALSLRSESGRGVDALCLECLAPLHVIDGPGQATARCVDCGHTEAWDITSDMAAAAGGAL